MSTARQRATVAACFALGVALVSLSEPPRRAARAPGRRTTGNETRLLARENPPFADQPRLDRNVVAAAARYDLDPVLVQAVILAESGARPSAVSARGAVGLMQVLPETANAMGLPETAVAAANLDVGCRYLSELLATFGGDVELALAAYNAGPGAVYKWGTVPPYAETRTFVSRVEANYRDLTGLDVATTAELAGQP